MTVLGHGEQPDWLLTIDGDVELPADFVSGWAAHLAEVHHDEGVGVLNGDEHQGHLLEPFPNARLAGAAFGFAVGRAEAAVGITNLNGVNHAVRTVAYLTAGPYLQPTMLGPDGVVNLAGEDWDLGVRLRLAGFRIEGCPVVVRGTRGRRLLADVLAYLFGRGVRGCVPACPRRRPAGHRCLDDRADHGWHRRPCAAALLLQAAPLQPELLDERMLRAGSASWSTTVEAMRGWIARWPHPTFTESRLDGFAYGRLARFAAAHLPAIRRDLGLTTADLARA